jgi:acyl carrier protein
VDYLNFVLELEKQLGIKIPEIECPRLASLDGCAGYFTSKLRS